MSSLVTARYDDEGNQWMDPNSQMDDGIDIFDVSVAAAATGLTTATPANILSQVLGPGTWEVTASYIISGTATTSFTESVVGLNTVSATLPASNKTNIRNSAGFVPPNQTYAAGNPALSMFTVPAGQTLTVYLVAKVTFTISTAGAGGTMHCQRIDR